MALETCERSSAYPAKAHEKVGFDEVENNIRKALCILETRTGNRTCGTLCEAKSGDQLLPLLIGTYASLPISAPDDLCDAVLKFSSLKTNKASIQCSRDTVRHIWCTLHLNAVVVELSLEAANECRSLGANFLKVGTARVSEEVTVWWWWRRRLMEPSAGDEGEPFVPMSTHAHFESVSAREANLLIPELIIALRALRRKESGRLGEVGECACVTNSKGEAIAMLPLPDVEERVRRDTPLELSQLGIDISPHMYQYKTKVTTLPSLVEAYIEEERKMRITVAFLKPLSGLSEKDFECCVCLDIAENVIECTECHNIFCEKHKDDLTQSCNMCPCCKNPLNTRENEYIRRLIAKLKVPCSECRVLIPRGDIVIHKLHFCSKRIDSNISGVTKLLSPVSSPDITVSENKAKETPFLSEHQLNKEKEEKECAEIERLLKNALRVAHKQRPLNSKTLSDGAFRELFEYLISIIIAMQGALNTLLISLEQSTTGMTFKPDNISTLVSNISNKIHMEEECQRAINGLCALITHLNSLRGIEYRQLLLRLTANEPSAVHTSTYSDIFHLIQEMNVHLAAMVENAEGECHNKNILKAIADTIEHSYLAVKAISNSAQSTIEETQGHTINTPPLQTSVGIDIAQKADYGVIEMSPFGGIEKISKASSKQEADNWKSRSKNANENIVTSRYAKEKDFEPLLSILAHSPLKLPQEAVKAPTEETIRQFYNTSKTNLSELRTALNDLNLFKAAKTPSQVPDTPAGSSIKEYRDRAAVSIVSVVFLLNALCRSKHLLMAPASKDKAEQVLQMITSLHEELAELTHQQEDMENLLLALANSVDKRLKMFSPIARALIG